MSLDNPAVYEDGGVVYYRASALGGCLHMLARLRQGYDAIPPGEQMQKVFAAGHEAERQAWAKGMVRGVAQNYVELKISDTICVSGHLDAWDPQPLTHMRGGDCGEAQYGGRASSSNVLFGSGRLYEVKSQSAAEWVPVRESPFWPRYEWQLSVYMLATGLPCRLLRVLRDADGHISDQAVEDFDTPPRTLAEIRARVFQVEMLARRDLVGAACERVEFPCPVFYTHPQADDREQLTDDGAVVLVEQYREAQRVAKAAKGRVEASRHALLSWLGDKKKIDLNDKYLVTKYEVKGRHVEYDAAGYTSIRVTEKEKKDVGQEGSDG